VANSALIEIFLNHCAVERGLSRNTIAAYRRDLTKFDSYLLEKSREFTTAESGDIAHFLQSLRISGLGESSIARHAVAIRSFFAFLAKDQGLIDISKEVSPPRIPKRLPKALSIAEVELLIGSCNDEPSGLRDKALLETLYATGGRVTEIVQLNVSDIAKEENQTTTIRVRGKGGKERLVPLGRFAQQALDQYLIRARPAFARNHHEQALFISEKQGNRLSRQSAWKIVSEAARRAGLEKIVSPHALRHSFATHLIDGGADIRVVQELLGHASVTTTQIYTLVTIDKLRESYASAHPRSR